MPSAQERLAARSMPDVCGCILWLGPTNADGYGRIRDDSGRVEYVHRIAYRLAEGPIPEGMVLDHICRVRNCIAPWHLEPVTRAENIRRGRLGYALRTHCRSGRHRINGPEDWFDRGQGRSCVHCRRESLKMSGATWRSTRRKRRSN